MKETTSRSKIKRQNILQLAIILIIIVLVNYISSFLFTRFDLTTEKRYTLSDHTKQLLENLDDRLYIKIYLEGEELPIAFKQLQRGIAEIFDEFSVYAGENIDYEFINPFKNIDVTSRNNVYSEFVQKGLNPVELKQTRKEGSSSRQVIFPGAIITYKGYELPVNLLKNTQGLTSDQNLNNSIQSLEYELTNGIRKLSRDNREKIAFLEGHGELNEYHTVDITAALSEYYRVERGRIGGQVGILDSFKVVIIAKPHGSFLEIEKFVIDQYIMNGGNVLWLVDGVKADMDSLIDNTMMIAMSNDINLDDQLFKYGARINHDLLLDLQSRPIGLTMMTASGQPDIRFFPWPYFPVIITSGNHHITRYLNAIKTEFISSLDTVGASSKIQKTILLSSSKMSKIMSLPQQISLDQIKSTPDEKQYVQPPKAIAVLLEGSFPSAYQNRPVPQGITNFKKLVTESKHSKQIIVSDGDIIRNEVSLEGEPYPLGFDRHTRQSFGGNKEFIVNAVNYLCDDEGLMSIRSREIKLRLLDKTKAEDEKITWQIINVLLPVIIIILFGIAVNFFRRKKFSR